MEGERKKAKNQPTFYASFVWKFFFHLISLAKEDEWPLLKCSLSRKSDAIKAENFFSMSWSFIEFNINELEVID